MNLLEGFSQGSGPTPAPEEAFLAGILHHMPALQTFTTPSPLSYERIKPGCWSGAYQCVHPLSSTHVVLWHSHELLSPVRQKETRTAGPVSYAIVKNTIP